MAQFSQGFLSSLGRPEMSQSLFGLGAAIGGVPAQLQQRRVRQEMAQYDPTTLVGRQGMLQAQLEQTDDPTQRLALGEQIRQLVQEKAAQELKKTQQQNTETLATQVETELKDPVLANLLRSGQATPSQGRAAIQDYNKAKQVAARGKAAQLTYLKAIGLESSPIISQIEAGEYEAVSQENFAKIVTSLQNAEKDDKIIAELNNRGEKGKQAAEDLELGIITRSQLSQRLSATKPTTKYADKTRMLLDGKVVWTADVTVPGQDEFPGYMDPETKEWKPVEAGQLKKIPQEQQKRLKEVTKSNLAIAAAYLAKDPAYVEDLTPTEKEQAQFKFAFRVKELIRNKKADSEEEAYEMAYEERGEFVKEGWFPKFLGDVKEGIGIGTPKQADDYLKEKQ